MRSMYRIERFRALAIRRPLVYATSIRTMKVYAQVVGIDTGDSAPSVMVATDSSRCATHISTHRRLQTQSTG